MTVVVLFGNGLSVGFDERFESRRLYEAVNARLGEDAAVLAELATLAAPEDPDSSPIGVDRGDFERLAGPLDRLADVMQVAQALSTVTADLRLLGPLGTASQLFRRHYLTIIGAVLSELASLCRRGNEELNGRLARWDALNSFVTALLELHLEQTQLEVFTINYDSLLLSAFLTSRAQLYDGFPGLVLDPALEARPHRLGLYHLHGYMGWVQGADGLLRKKTIDELHDQGILDSWTQGDPGRGIPTVLLGDLKSRMVRRDPFSLFYAKLERELRRTRRVVVGGYSFGDRPLNRVLAEYLSRSGDNLLEVWNREDAGTRFIRRLRLQFEVGEARIRPEQVIVKLVSLPDVAVVNELRETLAR